MLARVAPPTNDFKALARYLVRGKTRPTHPERVAWTTAHNLPTDEPKLAAAYMAATTALSKRCRNAAYHLMIAWRTRERPTPEMMQEIAAKTLALAGLAEHQALIMGHGDKPHPHLHMLINRVHPDTGRAWDTRHDFARFDRIMRELSEAHGFAFVSAHAFNPELTEHAPRNPNRSVTYAAKRGADTGRPQWSKAESKALGERISEHIDRGALFADLIQSIAEQGLTLEPKGAGYVVGNGSGYAKLSSLGLTMTAKGFEERFVRPPRRSTRGKPAPAGRSVFEVDAIDIARVIGSRDEVNRAVQEAVCERKARLARAPVMVQLMAEMQERWRAGTSLGVAQVKRCPLRKSPTPSRVPHFRE